MQWYITTVKVMAMVMVMVLVMVKVTVMVVTMVLDLQESSSKVGLERILTPISSLAGWVMVVAGVLSSVQV